MQDVIQTLQQFHWDWPYIFLLLPLPYLVWRWVPPVRQQVLSASVPFVDELISDTGEVIARPVNFRASMKMILALLCWLCYLAAMARPQWQGDPVTLPVAGRDLMLAVDISGSMQMQDFELSGTRIDRLTATKTVANTFIDGRKGDRVGLILFGSHAYMQVPLTFDRQVVKKLLDESVIGLAGKETAMGDAIALAVKRMKATQSSGTRKTIPERVLILLTDGASNAGNLDPLDAASLAEEAGIRIYTIGMGAYRMQEVSLFGTRSINPSADLDEETLKNIARKTQGRYFRAHDMQSLQKIYAEINQIEPVQRDTRIFRPLKDLFFWPLGIAFCIAFLLLLMELTGRHRRLRHG
ncbi:MAG: VWA domain-containing protein [Gammaproteobacteria bacterium]|nr:MAG: VWA domain-containing protein [Gammaproteobacteria bacterium]